MSFLGYRIKLLLAITLLCLFLPTSNQLGFAMEEKAALSGEWGQSSGKHLLLVLVPQFSFPDLELFLTHVDPSIQQDFQFAAMSMRTAGAVNLYNNLFTLSTGERSVGRASWNAYHRDEELQGVQVQDLYSQWSGRKSTASILHPLIFRVQQDGLKSRLSTAKLGWLGQQLIEKGIFSAGFGNSDTIEEKQRIAPTFVMNKVGEARGIVNEQVLSTDTNFPTGKKTNWTKLSTEISHIWSHEENSFLTVELGDLERISSQEEQMETNYVQQVRQAWFQEWSLWLEELIDLSRERKLNLEIWTISPMVSVAAKREGKILAPVITWSEGQEQGYLSSLSTKQEGLIANVDLLPSICHYFGLKQPLYVVGQLIQSASNTSSKSIETILHLSAWLQFLEYIFLIYHARSGVIKAYLSFVIFLLVLMTGYWWLDRKRKEVIQGIRVLIGGILLSPLYFLWLTPLIMWLEIGQWLSLLLLLSMLSSWLLIMLCRDDALFLAVLGLVNTFFILGDLIQGSPRMMRSFLGYDPIVGARFYGLGNEYAGFLLGSSLLAVIACSVWLKREQIFNGVVGSKNERLFLGVVFLFLAFTLYLIAAPNYGTNLGATLASAGAYLFLLPILCSWKWNLKWILGSLAVFILLGCAFLYYHLQAEHTHIGASLRLILSGGQDAFLDIVRRKWEMNLRLMRVSLWGKLFVTSIFVLTFYLFRWQRKKIGLSSDLWFHGLRVLVLGSLFILLVNDSGIVAAAATMLYVTFPTMYLRFSEQK